MADWVEEQIVKHEWTGNTDNISYGQILVRCKDCKFAEPSLLPSKHPWCSIHEFYREPDWFCADGERKEDND